MKEDEKWRTSAIASRVDNRTLKTTAGSVYILKGQMKPTEDLIPEVCQKFADGFPIDWKVILHILS